MNYIKNFYTKYEKIILKNLNIILLLLLCFFFLFIILINQNTIGGGNQWDFRSQYHAAKAYEAGLDPYDVNNANRFNNTPYTISWGHNYAYHPFALPYFQLFTKFPYSQAVMLYMLYTLALIFILIYLWKKFFLHEWVNIFIFSLVILFSFNKTLIIGLTSGNPAIFEAALLWLAFVFFCKNKPLLFLITISIVSFFKVTPILFSLMVFLLPGEKRNFIPFLVILTISIIIWLAPLVLAPQLFSSFWNYSSNLRETGIINPCAYSFIMDIFQKGGWKNTGFMNSFYLGWITFVFFIYFLIIRKLNWKEVKNPLVFFSFLTYAIIIPRFKDYAYIQLIPISYFLIMKNLALLFFNLFGIFSQGLKLPYFIEQYHPFLVAIINWGFFAFILSNSEESKPAAPVSPKIRVPFISTLKPQSALNQKMQQRFMVLLVTVFVLFLAYWIAKEVTRINTYVHTKNLNISLSGIKAKRATCGKYEIMMDMDFKGNPIKVNDIKYEKGIAVHAPSKITFKLYKNYRFFKASLGILDFSEGKGSVKFMVLGDGRKLYSSPRISGNQNPIPIEVNIEGIQELSLVVNDLEDRSFDHAAWLNPVLMGAYLPKKRNYVLSWECDRLDGIDELTLKDDQLTLNHIKFDYPMGINYKIFKSLSKNENINYRIIKEQGRGEVSIIEYPTKKNNFSLVIRIDDGPYPSYDFYRFFVITDKDSL